MSSTQDPRAEILAAIPHRDPFLLVDRIVESGEGWILTRWRVAPEAEWLRGHYPGFAVTPGVLLCEHAVQSGALLVSRALGGFRPEDGVPVLVRLSEARFRRMVRPGETVETRVSLEQRVGPAWFLSAALRVEGAKCATLSFVLSAAARLADSAS